MLFDILLPAGLQMHLRAQVLLQLAIVLWPDDIFAGYHGENALCLYRLNQFPDNVQKRHDIYR